MTEPSEQALPFSEAAIKAADRALEEPHGGRSDLEITRDVLGAAVNADPRAKAFLELARLSDEELVERVARIVGPRIEIRCGQCAGTGSDLRSNLDCTPCGATGYRVPRQPWREREARELAAEVLAALGLPVDEQETTG